MVVVEVDVVEEQEKELSFLFISSCRMMDLGVEQEEEEEEDDSIWTTSRVLAS